VNMRGVKVATGSSSSSREALMRISSPGFRPGESHPGAVRLSGGSTGAAAALSLGAAARDAERTSLPPFIGARAARRRGPSLLKSVRLGVSGGGGDFPAASKGKHGSGGGGTSTTVRTSCCHLCVSYIHY
jgi:hypothetical protein